MRRRLHRALGVEGDALVRKSAVAVQAGNGRTDGRTNNDPLHHSRRRHHRGNPSTYYLAANLPKLTTVCGRRLINQGRTNSISSSRQSVPFRSWRGRQLRLGKKEEEIIRDED